ncbi:hypothetical protein [Corynebacterium lubricantis]|uniref:hypothetical protein n=1 Tax=Corynebacterium lubricantis TaxID=541095 RepID=UPI00035F3CBD|nr:hypothetical protein [Corynebacterium lubricantis]
MSTNKHKERTQFSELPLLARVGIVAFATVDATAKIAALVDMSRRPADKIRGPKWAWAAAQAVNGFGPAAYWAFARREK